MQRPSDTDDNTPVLGKAVIVSLTAKNLLGFLRENLAIVNN